MLLLVPVLALAATPLEVTQVFVEATLLERCGPMPEHGASFGPEASTPVAFVLEGLARRGGLVSRPRLLVADGEDARLAVGRGEDVLSFDITPHVDGDAVDLELAVAWDGVQAELHTRVDDGGTQMLPLSVDPVGCPGDQPWVRLLVVRPAILRDSDDMDALRAAASDAHDHWRAWVARRPARRVEPDLNTVGDAHPATAILLGR